MTLCIAAACTHEDRPMIVTSSDSREEIAGLGSSNNADKSDFIHPGWEVLAADTQSRVKELVDLYKRSFREDFEHESPWTISDLLAFLKRPAAEFKKHLANDYINQSLGFTYDEFLSIGKQQLPDAQFTDLLRDVSRIELRAALLICGFLEHDLTTGKMFEPVMCVVQDDYSHSDVVRFEENFAAIGSGANVAIASLCSRRQHSDCELMETLYSVYEAHCLSKNVPGVGDTAWISIMDSGGKYWTLSMKGDAVLATLFRKYGPREGKKSDRRAQFDSKCVDMCIDWDATPKAAGKS